MTAGRTALRQAEQGGAQGLLVIDDTSDVLGSDETMQATNSELI